MKLPIAAHSLQPNEASKSHGFTRPTTRRLSWRFARAGGRMYNEVTLPVRRCWPGQHARGSEPMVEMSVESVRINLATNQRVVILREAQSDRYLFIWIANPEAYSIAMELQGTTSP